MSFFRSDDPIADFNRKDRAETKWLAKKPVCEYCGHQIQDERLFDYHGNLYHVECAEEAFLKWTEDYEL